MYVGGTGMDYLAYRVQIEDMLTPFKRRPALQCRLHSPSPPFRAVCGCLCVWHANWIWSWDPWTGLSSWALSLSPCALCHSTRHRSRPRPRGHCFAASCHAPVTPPGGRVMRVSLRRDREMAKSSVSSSMEHIVGWRCSGSPGNCKSSSKREWASPTDDSCDICVWSMRRGLSKRSCRLWFWPCIWTLSKDTRFRRTDWPVVVPLPLPLADPFSPVVVVAMEVIVVRTLSCRRKSRNGGIIRKGKCSRQTRK